MFDGLRDKLAARAMERIAEPWVDAARAWLTLLEKNPPSETDGAALWGVVDALGGALANLERSSRQGYAAATDPAVRRALAQTAYAAASAADALQRFITPRLEQHVGGPRRAR